MTNAVATQPENGLQTVTSVSEWHCQRFLFFGFVILCICHGRLTALDHSGKAMGIEIELLIAAADILLALLVAVSLPAREEIT